MKSFKKYLVSIAVFMSIIIGGAIPSHAVDIVVWSDNTPGNNEIFLKKSTDNGATWTSQRMTNNTGSSVNPSAATSGSNVYVAWQDDTYGNNEILLKKSTDSGNTWTSNRLTNNTGASTYPSAAASGSNVYITWTDNSAGNNEIFLKQSTDNGSTWTVKRLTNNTGNSSAPVIAVSGSNVYIAWTDDSYGNNEILLKKSSDNGATWTFQRLTNNTGYSGPPSIAVSGSNVYLAWEDNRYGNAEIFLRKSTDNGSTWTSQRITNNAAVSWYPSIAASGNNVYLAWDDNIYGNAEILLRKSTDNGTTWTSQRMTNNAGTSDYPSIMTTGADIYLAWVDTTYGNSEILLKKSSDNGATWTYKRMTNNAGSSVSPAMLRVASAAKAITTYSLDGVTGTIDETAKTIAVTMPYGTNVTALIATFTTTGASVNVGATTQTSGTTANDFTNPVVYTVTAEDSTTATYTVTVTVAVTVNDIDGNTYNTVTIGTQVWLKENLKTTKYRNGDAIGTTTSNIGGETSPKYQWAYGNVATYGRLYTWYAVTDSRGVCPTGWHVPTDAEWTILTDYLGGGTVAGGKMKEAGTTHWLSPNTGADNSSGFTALPGGYHYNLGTFYGIGYGGLWWSATEISAAVAWGRGLYYAYGDALRDDFSKNYGFSVRCVLNSTKAITTYSLDGVTGTIDETAKTIAVNMPYSTNVTALIATFTTTGVSVNVGATTQTSGTTANDFTSPVIYTVTAKDSTTAVYTVTVTVAVNDIDGNTYNTVTIGTQVWLRENLKVTKYRNGDVIGTTTSNIGGEISPKYQWAYNGNEGNVATYGRLYTWYAVTDSRGVCPAGWHVPTDAEWTILTDYLGGTTVAGGKMKEAGTTHWYSPNAEADNSSGFTALPGGGRDYDGTFFDIGYFGYWWPATGYYGALAWFLDLCYSDGSAYRNYYLKNGGFSVRCIRD